MKVKSRFWALQVALFAWTVVAAGPVLAIAGASSTDTIGVPTVPRHRVVRRHLLGHPAFTMGALGRVDVDVPLFSSTDSHTYNDYAAALAAQAVEFFETDKKENAFHYHNIMHPRPQETIATSRLVWTGQIEQSRDGAYHLRYQQYFDDKPVEGGNIMLHTDDSGANIVAVNGEYVDCRSQLALPVESYLPSAEAMQLAFASMSGQAIKGIISQTAPVLTLVVGDDLSCCLAYQSEVTYHTEEEEEDDGKNANAKIIEMRDIISVNVFEGNVCARDPLVVGHAPRSRFVRRRTLVTSPSPPSNSTEMPTARSPQQERQKAVFNSNRTIIEAPEAVLATYYCKPFGNDTHVPPQEKNCTLISNSSDPISTGHMAIDCAHNYALATFQYFWNFHGLNSLNGFGFKLKSYVLSEDFNVANAFWNGYQMTYGDGSDRFWPLSQAPDVVAHELTHGVTQFSSRLLYSNESGALNEAISDIFGALVDRQMGATEADIWLIGEAVVKSGGAMRDMSFPSRIGHFDFYPLRYQGEKNNGGVHWNSGIANLAFKLLITGGTHPRRYTNVNVTGLLEIFANDEDLAFSVAGQIFYCANSQCLTRRSTFIDARHCTATICGSNGLPEDKRVSQSIHEAWEAVGVKDHSQLDMDGPTDAPTISEEEHLLTFSPSMLETEGPFTKVSTPTPTTLVTEKPSVAPSSIPSQFSLPSEHPSEAPTHLTTLPFETDSLHQRTTLPSAVSTTSSSEVDWNSAGTSTDTNGRSTGRRWRGLWLCIASMATGLGFLLCNRVSGKVEEIDSILEP